MPKVIARTISSPALSSDSSLSSAPEAEDFALEDPITSLSVDQIGAVALLEETAVELAQSNKRRRTEETTEANGPAKRARRNTVTGLNYKEVEKGEEEKGPPTKALGTSPQNRRRSARALNAGIETAAVKSEIEEEVDIASKGIVKRVQRRTKVNVEAVTEEDLGSKSLKRSRKRAKISIETKVEEQASIPCTPKKSKKKKKTVAEEKDVAAEEVVDESPKKAKRKRKTKEEKEAEAMPLAARATGLKVYLGAHVSSAKGSSSLQSGSPKACTYVGRLD